MNRAEPFGHRSCLKGVRSEGGRSAYLRDPAGQLIELTEQTERSET
jgi:hypothetical protein